MRLTYVILAIAAWYILTKGETEGYVVPFGMKRARAYKKNKNKNKKSKDRANYAGSPVPGRPGFVYGKRGGVAYQSAYERKYGRAPLIDAGSPVPGRPGFVYGKRGGIASQSAYERKYGRESDDA